MSSHETKIIEAMPDSEKAEYAHFAAHMPLPNVPDKRYWPRKLYDEYSRLHAKFRKSQQRFLRGIGSAAALEQNEGDLQSFLTGARALHLAARYLLPPTKLLRAQPGNGNWFEAPEKYSAEDAITVAGCNVLGSTSVTSLANLLRIPGHRVVDSRARENEAARRYEYVPTLARDLRAATIELRRVEDQIAQSQLDHLDRPLDQQQEEAERLELSRDEAETALGLLQALDNNLTKTSRDLTSSGEVPFWVHEEAEAENFWRDHRWMLRSQTELVCTLNQAGKLIRVGPERDLAPASALPWNAKPTPLRARKREKPRALRHESHVLDWHTFNRTHLADEHVRLWRRRASQKAWLGNRSGQVIHDLAPSNTARELKTPRQLWLEKRNQRSRIWKNYSDNLDRWQRRKEENE